MTRAATQMNPGNMMLRVESQTHKTTRFPFIWNVQSGPVHSNKVQQPRDGRGEARRGGVSVQGYSAITVVTVAQHREWTKNHTSVHLKMVYFILCELSVKKERTINLTPRKKY